MGHIILCNTMQPGTVSKTWNKNFLCLVCLLLKEKFTFIDRDWLTNLSRSIAIHETSDCIPCIEIGAFLKDGAYRGKTDQD